MRPPNLLDVRIIESPDTSKSNWFCIVSGLIEVFHLLAIQSSRLGLLALRQDSETVQEPDNLRHRNPHIQPANSCNETSKRGKETNNASTNFCQRFCVMDAPEIYQSPALVVVSEFLTAIQASDVGFSAMNRSVSR